MRSASGTLEKPPRRMSSAVSTKMAAGAWESVSEFLVAETTSTLMDMSSSRLNFVRSGVAEPPRAFSSDITSTDWSCCACTARWAMTGMSPINNTDSRIVAGGFMVRPSKIHSTGCYTTTPIAGGSFVVEYTGPRLTKEAADERYSEQEETYLFGLDDGEHVIDGFGVAAFINHSCDPNCETDEL